MELGVDAVDSVRQLLEHTTRECAAVLETAKAIIELDGLLEAADGTALQPLYAKVPARLAGVIELFYDLGHVAHIRFIEPLLYRSDAYREQDQRLSIQFGAHDRRPFILSTPRLPTESSVELQVPFSSPFIDVLARARTWPTDADVLMNALPIDGVGAAKLLEATESPSRAPAAPRFEGTGMRVRYFGHACVLVEGSGVSVLVDPFVSFSGDAEPSRFTIHDIPERIDAVLLSHGHQDHALIETLLQLRHRVDLVVVPRSGPGTLVDPSMRLWLESIGFLDVVEISELQEVSIGAGCTVVGLPFIGEHADLAIHTKIAYAIRLGGCHLGLGIDSSNDDPAVYVRTAAIVGDFDAILIGMECVGAPLPWLYGPLFAHSVPNALADSRRLAASDASSALAIVDAFHARKAYVYAMGFEPWTHHILAVDLRPDSRQSLEIDAFLLACRARGVEARMLLHRADFVLQSA